MATYVVATQSGSGARATQNKHRAAIYSHDGVLLELKETQRSSANNLTSVRTPLRHQLVNVKELTTIG